jgi:histidinol-phosphate aminotransferase
MGGLPPGYDLLLGNGSDEIIAMLSSSLQPQACVMAPVPSFVYYQMAAQQHRLPFVGVPLKENFELDMPALKQAIEKHQPSLIHLAYPNNPTANLPRDQDVHELMSMAPGFVVVDEAYTPFAERSFAPYLQRYPQMLLMRTFSKWGLAGLRIGYLVGPSKMIEHINKLRPPYNISALNAEAALFALEHAPVFEAQAKAIVEQRAYLYEKLSQWPQLTVFPSQANMLLVRVPHADACFEALKAQGVLVKNVSKMHPLLAECLRITIGTPAENERLLAVFEKIL